MSDKKAKKILKENKYILISQIATKRGIRRRGIGRFLYENIFLNFKDTYFFAFIVTSPIKNKTSIKFHKKMGFKTVSSLSLDEYKGIKDYQSILLIKNA